MSRPRIVRLPDGGVALSFPFPRPLIDALKQTVPAGYRSYDPGDHAWTIAAAYANDAIRLLQRTFPHAEVVDAVPATNDAWAALHLKDTAPPELVEVAYRCLARLHHPDRGGDHEGMIVLNSAYDWLRTATR